MNNRLPIIISVIALVLAVSTWVISMKSRQKTGYVIIQELFENFELKKELEKDYNLTRSVRKKILDSLQIDISLLSKKLSSSNAPPKEDVELFERKKIELNQRMQEFDQSNLQMTKEFDEKIIAQLNQYVSDFGKEFDYDMIYGNTSNGSIMYGTDKNNITKEVQEFINQKYKGLK